MDREQRRADFARRRRAGVAIGAILAFVFGGWPGLFIALAVASLARLVEMLALQHARPQ